MDGWSLQMVLKEVFELYESFSSGRDITTAAGRPYRDYIAWLRQQDISQAETFWRQMLKGFTTPTTLRLERHHGNGNGNGNGNGRPHHDDDGFDKQSIQLTEETTVALQALARQHQLTLNTFVQGVWALLLGHYGGAQEAVFGVTVSGRPAELAGVEEIVGLFINTLPIRFKVSPEMEILEWLKDAQAQAVELRQYEHTPLADAQRWSEVARGLPLFESIVVFENYPFERDMQERASGIRIDNVRTVDWNNFPLCVTVAPGAELNIEIKHQRRRFAANDMAWLAQQFESLLRTIVEQPQARLLTLNERLVEADRQQQTDREADYRNNLRQQLRSVRRQRVDG
jgi:non-ribosomal peptide synthetase component F